MASPAERFAPASQAEREALPLRLPAALAAASAPLVDEEPEVERVLPLPPPPTPGAVEFDRVVPASGNLSVEGTQFWLGAEAPPGGLPRCRVACWTGRVLDSRGIGVCPDEGG
jgi:hypothetical protein